MRTAGQDTATIPTGWKIYQSVTGDSVGSLKMKREGLTDYDALEMFPNSEVKIGNIANGTGGDGSFRTEGTKFSVPGTREKPVLHHSWQNRDIVEIKATADGGLFSESTSVYKPGTVLTFNSFGQYKRARWNANPSDGYKDAEVVGILEKVTSDDFVLQVPVISGVGSTYSTSLFSQYENVSIVGNGKTVYGYVYETLPASGLSGIKIFVDSYPSGVTSGWFTRTTGSIFVGGATLRGSADNDLIGISSGIGITVTPVNYGVIVRQGVFEIPTTGVGATGYDAITTLGLSAGYLFYLGGTFGGNQSNCYGGVTYAPNNLFDPQVFYNAGANVAKPVFIYLGTMDGKKMGLFQAYQGLGLDASGSAYMGFDGGMTYGITFGTTVRSFYPFGATYSGGAANPSTNTLVSGYITDGYFLDTLNRTRTLYVKRQTISSTLPSMASPPNYELKMTQVTGGTNTGRARLYSVIPDHKTLSGSDFNFSFYAKSDSGSTVGITVGTAFVWNAGSTYAVIESKGAFLSSGSGTSGGKAYTANLTSEYARYQFAFSSESLTYSGAVGANGSFIAPFIEMGLTLDDGRSIHITGLQLSKGISPKPYEKRSPSDEKSECDRFFQNIVIGNGGYYPISTGSSGPKIFAATTLPIPLAEIPQVVTATDVNIIGMIGASASGDPKRIQRDSLSVLRDTDTISSTYHRYFESVYSLDASGFSGSVSARLMGMT